MAIQKSTIFSFLKNIFQSSPIAAGAGAKREYPWKPLERSAGLETQLQNPSQLLTDKGESVRIYDTLMLDETIRAAVELKITLALSVDGDVMPASDRPEDVERAEIVSKMLHNMVTPIWSVFREMLYGMVYGYRVGEKVWVNGTGDFEGMWILKDIKWKHPVLYDFDYDCYGNFDKLYIGYYYGAPSKAIQGEGKIAQKFIVCTWPYVKNGNRYGESDLESIYMQWYTKYQIYRWRGVYLQNFGMPIIEARYDQTQTNASEKRELEDMLQNWQETMWFLNPGKKNKDGEIKGKFEFKMHEASDTNTDQYETSIENINNDIRRRLLVPDNLGYSSQQTGSLAKSKTELQIFTQVIRELHGRLEDWINPTIAQIEDYNIPGVKEHSEWKFRDIDERMEQETLRALIDTGVVDPRENWVRQYMGIPEITVQERQELNDQAVAPGTPTPQDMPSTDEITDMEGGDPEENFKTPKQPFNQERIEKTLDTSESEFQKEYASVHAENSESLVNQVKRKYNLEDKSYKWLNALRIPKTDLKNLMTIYYFKLFTDGKVEAIKEVLPRWKKRVKQMNLKAPEKFQLDEEYSKRKFVEDKLSEYGDLGVLTKEDAERLKELRELAFVTTGDEQRRMINAITGMLRDNLDRNVPLRDVIPQIEGALRDDRKKYATTIARTNASQAYNSGRWALYQSENVRPMIEAYQYSAVMDLVTTDFCRHHNGQIIRADDPRMPQIIPPNHFNCRSTLIPIMIGDNDDKNSYYHNYENKKKDFPKWGTGAPVTAREPAKGFGGT